VAQWLAAGQAVAGEKDEPQVETGGHCHSPFDCGFFGYCTKDKPKPCWPVTTLPRMQAVSLREFIALEKPLELQEVPDHLLNEKQRRVKQHSLAGTVYFNRNGAGQALAQHPFPAYFLDFETSQLAVPLWQGNRPYRQIPFQFSVHRLDDAGELTHREFLDLSGNDPCRPFAEALLACCGTTGVIFVYNAGFEGGRICELAARFPDLAADLLALHGRLFDLLRIAERYYYHPDQRGSWSIKRVLPTVAPELSYDNLSGVKDGGMAMAAYLEAIGQGTTEERKQEIRHQLSRYCALDTFAMVRLWQVFANFTHMEFQWA
jgi:hypothetical protein